MWAACPRHHGYREQVGADIWVATPASLVHSAVPGHQNDEQIRYLELACRRSDLIIVDEADRVQMQLDAMFAPAATLIGRSPDSLLDNLQRDKIEELAREGRLQLSEQTTETWVAAMDTVTTAANRLYGLLVRHPRDPPVGHDRLLQRVDAAPATAPRLVPGPGQRRRSRPARPPTCRGQRHPRCLPRRPAR